MNGNGYDYEEDLAILEAMEYEEEPEEFFPEDEDEFSEARRRQRRRRQPAPKTGRGEGYSKPRPSANHVTQAQLQSALARVAADVKANAEGIKQVNGRLNALGDELTRQATVLKQEAQERKKANAL